MSAPALVLQRHFLSPGDRVINIRLLQGLDEAWPEAGANPPAVVGVDGGPRPEVRRHRPPGGAGAGDPEDGGEHRALVAEGAPPRFRSREEGSDTRPLRVGQLTDDGVLARRGWWGRQAWSEGRPWRRPVLGGGAAGDVAPPGAELMGPPPVRPVQVEGAPFGRLAQRAQEPPHLRHGQRVLTSGAAAPFSGPLVVRVTSR